MGSLWGEEEPVKRVLGTRDKQILYERAHHECENCHRHLEFSEMLAGHKKAYAKGGRTTLKNSVALCFGCNKLQGTDSWEVFQRKQGKAVPINPIEKVKEILRRLNLQQLKYLAAKHDVKPKGKFVEGGFLSYDSWKAPSKDQYVKALAKVVSQNEVQSGLREMLEDQLGPP